MQLFSLRKILILAMLVGSPSLWATIILTPSDCTSAYPCWTSPVNSQPGASDIASLVGTSTILSMLYKSDQGGPDSGLAANWYSTTYENSASDPQDALIEWLGGESLSCSECYLSIKDGNSDPSLYVFDISSWDGQMDIDMNGFWPQQGAISNVAIWGPGNSSVPEPSILGLLGFTLLGLGIIRRRRIALS